MNRSEIMSTSTISTILPYGSSDSSPNFGKGYSIRNADATYFYIPPCTSTINTNKPIMIDASTGEMTKIDRRLDLEWVPHSTPVAMIYLAIAISSTLYYASCFLRQFDARRAVTDWLGEATLTRVVMSEWLVIAVLLLTGIFLYRRVFVPVYIFFAVVATNGTLVLFILKIKQLIDGRIDYFDIPLNLLGVLLFFAIVHNIVYFYAMHLHLLTKSSPPSPYYSTIRPTQFLANSDVCKVLDFV